MNKIASILIFSIAFIGSLTTQAQFKQLAEGPVFEEPEDGFAKILQMRNGNTFYVHVTLKDGINIRIYDPGHTEKIVTTVSPAYSELEKNDRVEGVFEINNKVIILVSRIDEGLPTLIRLIIDGNSGKLLQQKSVGSLKKEWKPSFGMTAVPHFFLVRKDPDTDNYAVAIFNYRGMVYNKRQTDYSPVEIIHYGSENNEISRKFCNVPDDNETRCALTDMVVIGPEKVIALLRFISEKGSRSMLGILEKGVISYKETSLSYSYNSYYTFKYNPVTKKIIWMITSLIDGRKEYVYGTNLYMLDLAGQLTEIRNFGTSQKLQDEYKEAFGKKEGYQGMPQNIIINSDGGFTVLYEEIAYIQKENGNGTELGVVGVSDYDREGKMISDYLIPKRHWILGTQLYPFYVQDRELAAQMLYKGNQYKSFVYLHTTKGSYVLCNDTERNKEIRTINFISTRDNLIMVQGVTGDCDAYMYSLRGDTTILKKEYLFGEKDKGHALALLTISAYDKKNNMYVTLMLDKKNMRNKMVSVVWLQPQ